MKSTLPRYLLNCLLCNLFSMSTKVTDLNPSPDLNNLRKLCPEHFVPFYYLFDLFYNKLFLPWHKWIDVKHELYPLHPRNTFAFYFDTKSTEWYWLTWNKQKQKRIATRNSTLTRIMLNYFPLLVFEMIVTHSIFNAIKEIYSSIKHRVTTTWKNAGSKNLKSAWSHLYCLPLFNFILFCSKYNWKTRNNVVCAFKKNA